jgi:hypothetical protein
MGLMSTRDFENYFALFNLMSSLIEPPDLLIYLRANIPTLVDQIQQRGRKYENNIRLDYLKHLNERYEAWVETYSLGKLLIVDVDNLNFRDKARRPECDHRQHQRSDTRTFLVHTSDQISSKTAKAGKKKNGLPEQPVPVFASIKQSFYSEPDSSSGRKTTSTRLGLS